MAGPEKNIEDQIKDYLEDKGYWYTKIWAKGGVKKGIPDILCVINGYFVTFEVKRSDHKGHITPIQKKNAQNIVKNNGTAVFISQMSTLYVIEDYLLSNKNIKKMTIDDKSILHLDDEPESIYSTNLYEGLWR